MVADDARALHPESEVWPPPPLPMGESLEPEQDPVQRILELPGQNLFLFVFLLVITLGFYIYFWGARLAFRLRRALPEAALPPAWIIFVVVFGLFTLLLGVGEGVYTAATNTSLTLTQDALDHMETLANNILVTIFTFQIRNRINRLIEVPSGGRHWFGAVWTFLFGALYIQIKINRIRRAVLAESAGA